MESVASGLQSSVTGGFRCVAGGAFSSVGGGIVVLQPTLHGWSAGGNFFPAGGVGDFHSP